MNERIREVWIKAASEDSDPDNWDTQEQFMEKFAELSVRECANVANSGIDPAESHLIGNDILEHFGVEE